MILMSISKISASINNNENDSVRVGHKCSRQGQLMSADRTCLFQGQGRKLRYDPGQPALHAGKYRLVGNWSL